MELAGGAFIFGAFLLVYTLVIIYSLYTRRGSGINQHPYRDPYGDAPGAWRQSTIAHDTRAAADYVRGTR